MRSNGPLTLPAMSQATNVQRSEKPRRSALARATLKAASLISVPSPIAFGQFAEQRQQQRARAGADIEDAQRLHAPAAMHDKVERGLDHGLGFRPRHQNVGRHDERQAPEFLAAENARHRLALEPARGHRGHRVDFTRSRMRSACAISCARSRRKRVAEQGARIHARRFNAGGLERLRDQADGVGNTGAGFQPGDDSHVAPSAASSSAWCSVTSASITSCKASPSITCGNL